jgi:glycine dehydrogenase
MMNRKPLALGPSRGESEMLSEFKTMMSQNVVARSHIGTGYYDTITPPVILRYCHLPSIPIHRCLT